jgi:hypothetical protein
MEFLDNHLERRERNDGQVGVARDLRKVQREDASHMRRCHVRRQRSGRCTGQ